MHLVQRFSKALIPL